MRKTRLCIVVDHYPACNGAYYQGLLLARELKILGGEVFFVSYLAKGRGGPLCTFGPNEMETSELFTLDPNVSGGWKAVWFYMRLFFNLRNRYDQVLIQGLPESIYWILPLWRLLGKKVFIRLTGLNINDPVKVRRSKWGFIKNLTIQLAQRHINPSRAMESVYRQNAMIPSKSAHIPNGVDTERFRPLVANKKTGLRQELGYSPQDRIVLYVGTIRRAKGIDLLLDAWDRVLAEVPQALLVMIGPFCPVCPGVKVADKEFIERIRPKIGFFVRDNEVHLLQNKKNRIQFLGVVDRVERYYSIAEVFAFPSRREGMPNVVMEAMASGLPVVANDIGEVTGDLIQNEQEGVVVGYDDTNGFAEAIIGLLNHPNKRRQIARTARKKMEDNFSPPQFAKRYSELFQSG